MQPKIASSSHEEKDSITARAVNRDNFLMGLFFKILSNTHKIKKPLV